MRPGHAQRHIFAALIADEAGIGAALLIEIGTFYEAVFVFAIEGGTKEVFFDHIPFTVQFVVAGVGHGEGEYRIYIGADTFFYVGIGIVVNDVGAAAGMVHICRNELALEYLPRLIVEHGLLLPALTEVHRIVVVAVAHVVLRLWQHGAPNFFALIIELGNTEISEESFLNAGAGIGL